MGTYSATTDVSLASLGYANTEYSNWTNDNFCYTFTMALAKASVSSKSTQAWSRAYPATLTYNSETGILRVVPAYARASQYYTIASEGTGEFNARNQNAATSVYLIH